MDVPISRFQYLISKSLGLVAVPAEVGGWGGGGGRTGYRLQCSGKDKPSWSLRQSPAPLSAPLEKNVKCETCPPILVQVLGSNLETLAAVLDVEVNMVLELVIRQPTLLAAQV